MSIRRLDILQRLANRFSYKSYLEIGVAGGATFKHIEIEDRIGVDPKWRLWYAFDRRVKKTTSDRFFASNRRHFDLVFIDGLHVAEQAYRDIRNALAVLRPGGTVVVHDCMPSTREQQLVPRIQTSWTGDVWRAFLKASQDPELATFILDTNRGCGVIRREPRAAPQTPPAGVDPLDETQVSWEDYLASRERWLRIYPPAEVYAAIDALPAGPPAAGE